MRTILKDIGQEIAQNSVLNTMFSTRVFSTPPKNEPTSPYLVFSRTRRVRNDVRNIDRILFEVYSTTVADLENAADALLAQFDGATQIGTDNNSYFTIQFIEESDNPIPMKDTGMFVKLLYFDFMKTS